MLPFERLGYPFLIYLSSRKAMAPSKCIPFRAHNPPCRLLSFLTSRKGYRVSEDAEPQHLIDGPCDQIAARHASPLAIPGSIH